MSEGSMDNNVKIPGKEKVFYGLGDFSANMGRNRFNNIKKELAKRKKSD